MSKTVKDNYVNPFEVTYDVFDKALGKKTVKDYCKGKQTESEIEWLTTEIKNFKNNNKNK